MRKVTQQIGTHHEGAGPRPSYSFFFGGGDPGEVWSKVLYGVLRTLIEYSVLTCEFKP